MARADIGVIFRAATRFCLRGVLQTAEAWTVDRSTACLIQWALAPSPMPPQYCYWFCHPSPTLPPFKLSQFRLLRYKRTARHMAWRLVNLFPADA